VSSPLWVISGHSDKSRDVRFVPIADIQRAKFRYLASVASHTTENV
jgi:hypothetical protein